MTLAATQLRAAAWLAFDGVIVGLTAGRDPDRLRQRLARRPRAARRRPPRSRVTRCSSRRSCCAFAVNGWRPATRLVDHRRAGEIVPGRQRPHAHEPARAAAVGAGRVECRADARRPTPSSSPSGAARRAGRRRRSPPAVPIAGGAICVALLMHAALARQPRRSPSGSRGRRCSSASLRAAFLLRENQRARSAARSAEAATDKLTGLPNRRALIDDLDRAVAARHAAHARVLRPRRLQGVQRRVRPRRR